MCHIRTLKLRVRHRILPAVVAPPLLAGGVHQVDEGGVRLLSLLPGLRTVAPVQELVEDRGLVEARNAAGAVVPSPISLFGLPGGRFDLLRVAFNAERAAVDEDGFPARGAGFRLLDGP